MAAGRDQITEPDGATKISEALNGYIAPDAVPSIYHGVARSLRFERYSVRYDYRGLIRQWLLTPFVLIFER